MDAPSPPPAPDPKETAAAQSQMNKETAVAQYGLNATNQVTPQGTLTYKQIGTWADGTPRFEATTAYSPTARIWLTLALRSRRRSAIFLIHRSSWMRRATTRFRKFRRASWTRNGLTSKRRLRPSLSTRAFGLGLNSISARCGISRLIASALMTSRILMPIKWRKN